MGRVPQDAAGSCPQRRPARGSGPERCDALDALQALCPWAPKDGELLGRCRMTGARRSPCCQLVQRVRSSCSREAAAPCPAPHLPQHRGAQPGQATGEQPPLPMETKRTGPMNQHPPGLHRRQQGLDVTAGMWMAARSPQACFVPTFLESWIPRWASIGMCRVSSDWFALNRTSEVGNLVCGGDRAQATQSSQWEAQFGDRLAGLGWRDPSRGLVLTGRLWMLLCP
ncbi:uncharacterized protein LOC115618545 isoform X2 [Strigops habroptila]|uniref:uncharacterized protein LOC115618545 isoform X2 n=1 Tax=Strigops habroptila TaxID=2489341 RepID=UPI0011CFA752|nr:uncharacterized protein LOC115618545 isoform X2 [Strigops habroptila]